jgi:hypothetical protein
VHSDERNALLWGLLQVYVVFDGEEAAKAALGALAGCAFMGRIVVGTFVTQDVLDGALERVAATMPSLFPNLHTSLVTTPSFTGK